MFKKAAVSSDPDVRAAFARWEEANRALFEMDRVEPKSDE